MEEKKGEVTLEYTQSEKVLRVVSAIFGDFTETNLTVFVD